MPPPPKVISWGETGFYEAGLKKGRRVGDLDTLRGVYVTDHDNAFMPGDQAPEYPGMLIMDAESEHSGASYSYRLNCLGTLDGSSPEKYIGRKERRTLEATWDSLVVDMYHPAPSIMTFSVQTDDTFITGLYRLRVGMQIRILTLAGGAGLTAGSDYYVSEADGAFLKLQTLAGVPVDITTNGSGTFVATNCARGVRWTGEGNNVGINTAYMYLSDVDVDQEGAEDLLYWKRVRLSYLGIIGSKPYKRTITVNGKTISSDSIQVGFPGGGWIGARKGTVQQPTIEVAHLQVFSADPQLYQHCPTSDVLNTLGESGRVIPAGIVIPSPPAVNPIFGLISGADTVSQWPNRWSFVACEKADEIPGTGVVLMRLVWRYEWPLTM